jgi:hypothetical protein
VDRPPPFEGGACALLGDPVPGEDGPAGSRASNVVLVMVAPGRICGCKKCGGACLWWAAEACCRTGEAVGEEFRDRVEEDERGCCWGSMWEGIGEAVAPGCWLAKDDEEEEEVEAVVASGGSGRAADDAC